MPRDGAGNYSLPVGYLAVTGDVIEPSQHNPPLEDLASAMTDSISRTGVTAITANIPLAGYKITALGNATADTDALNRITADGRYLATGGLPNGSAAAPALTFASDPDTGLYRAGANAIGFATSGTLRFTITDGAGQPTFLASGIFGFADGSGSAPGITFTSDTDTGIWRPGANQFAFSTSGVERIRISAGAASAPILQVAGYTKIFGNTDDSSASMLYLVSASDLGRFVFRNDGHFQSPETYTTFTTGSAANVFIDTNGGFFRSTSSLRYKQDVEDYAPGLAGLGMLRPVTFAAKGSPEIRFAGFLAEDVHDAGLTEYVVYDDAGRPDALHYSQMVALLTSALKEASAKIDALTARVEALGG